jgi:hypothetical protein
MVSSVYCHLRRHREYELTRLPHRPVGKRRMRDSDARIIPFYQSKLRVYTPTCRAIQFVSLSSARFTSGQR